MKNLRLISSLLAICLFSSFVFAQNVKPKTRQDLQQQIASAKQEKNILVEGNNQFTRVKGNSMTLGTRLLFNNADDNPLGDLRASGTKIPSWRLVPYYGFPTENLAGNVSDFMLMFYVYDVKFQKDSDLVLNLDGQELTFQAIEKGRQLNSDFQLHDGGFGKDQTNDDQRNNAANFSQDSKPYFSTFRILRADMEKLLKAEKVKITLSKQYQVTLRKDFKATLQTMFDLATLK